MTKKIMLIFLLTMTLGVFNLKAGNLLTPEWKAWISAPARTSGCDSSIKNGTVTAIIKKTEKQPQTCFQLIQDVKLEKNKKYKLSFKLKTTENGIVNIRYILSKSPYSSYFSKHLKISPGKENYECEISPKVSGEKYPEPRSLRFYLGAMPDSKITISNIKLVEIK